ARSSLVAQALDQLFHVLRQRRGPRRLFSRPRMHQAQLRRVQRLPGKRDAAPRAALIDGVAYEGVANMLEMHPGLARASRLEPALDERGPAIALEHPVRGARGLAAMGDRHSRARARIATDRRIDAAARRRIALHYCEVDAVHRALRELLRELGLRRDVF